MTYTLVIKEEARQDMLAAYLYYEEQQVDLGERFLSEVQKCFEDLSLHPEFYSYIDKKKILRDITINNFPYVLIYKVVMTEVHIHAVFHTSRRPRKT